MKIGMTPQEKKDLIKKRLEAPGEKRSYNEIAADLELEIWTEQHGRNISKQRKP